MMRCLVELPGVEHERRAEQVPADVDAAAGQAAFGHERVGGLQVGGGDPVGGGRAGHCSPSEPSLCVDLAETCRDRQDDGLRTAKLSVMNGPYEHRTDLLARLSDAGDTPSAAPS